MSTCQHHTTRTHTYTITHAYIQLHVCTPSHSHTHIHTYTPSHSHTSLTHTHTLTPPHSQEEDGSSMSVGSRGLPPLPNSDRYNLIRQRLERYRRGSEGNFRTPTEIILRLPPRLPGNTVATHKMERASSHFQSRGPRQEHCRDAQGRAISPSEGSMSVGRPRSQSLDAEDVPLSVSHMYNPDEMDSGSST